MSTDAFVKRTKLLDTAGTNEASISTGGAIKVDNSAVTQPISAASLPLPAGAATLAKQPALGTAGSASADVISIQGVASMTAVKVDGSGATQPVSGTVGVTGVATATNQTGGGQKTQIVDGSGNVIGATTNAMDINIKSGNITGFATAAKQPALGTAGTASSDVITIQGIASMTKILVTPDANSAINVAQINGATPLMGAGNTGTGSARVTIASDQAAIPVSESGTWTVQPGNTANTTAWLVSNRPGTSGGFTTYHLASAGSTNATVVKASAGQLFGWYIYNSNAAARKLAFHNAASTPTAGASIFFTIMIPPTSAANVFTETGIAFSTGIAVTTVTGLADNDSTGVAANDLIVNLWYA